MPAETFAPPGSLVVIHGVGSQKEDETARALARALAATVDDGAAWCPPTFVTRVGEVLCAPCRDPGEGTFSFASYRIDRIEASGQLARLTTVYEFYWADLSRSGEGLWGEVRQTWRLLVGLPRVGYQALTDRASGLAGAILALLRGLYGAAWFLVVTRMLVALAAVVAMSWKWLGDIRRAELLLPLDLLTGAVFLAIAAALGLLLLRDGRRALGGWAAVLSLSVTSVLTRAVPDALYDVVFKIDDREVAYYAPPAAPPVAPWITFPLPGINAYWFYSPNTLPGFAPRFLYGLIVLWAVLIMALIYGLLARWPSFTGEGRWLVRGWVRLCLGVVLVVSHLFGALVAAFVLVVAPVLLWMDFARMKLAGLQRLPRFRGMIPMWKLLYLEVPPEKRGNWTPAQHFYYNFAHFWDRYLVYAFILTIGGIILWPWLRKAIAPALELAYDVGNYFPRVPVLNTAFWTRLLRGDRGPRELEAVLTERLRALLLFAYQQQKAPPPGGAPSPGGAVAVVGHSLGSIIALAALKDWAAMPDGSPLPADLEIDLVTMGSPFGALAAMFPHLYEKGRPEAPLWRMPRVRRWLNLYRAADLIGRDLRCGYLREGQPRPVADRLLGSGGHIGYFDDAQMAARLLRWLRHPEEAAGA